MPPASFPAMAVTMPGPSAARTSRNLLRCFLTTGSAVVASSAVFAASSVRAASAPCLAASRFCCSCDHCARAAAPALCWAIVLGRAAVLPFMRETDLRPARCAARMTRVALASLFFRNAMA